MIPFYLFYGVPFEVKQLHVVSETFLIGTIPYSVRYCTIKRVLQTLCRLEQILRHDEFSLFPLADRVWDFLALGLRQCQCEGREDECRRPVDGRRQEDVVTPSGPG